MPYSNLIKPANIRELNPKLLNYARFEPLVVGIQENLICPSFLPINLDEDGRVGTSFL